jgi:hypothetical protein
MYKIYHFSQLWAQMCKNVPISVNINPVFIFDKFSEDVFQDLDFLFFTQLVSKCNVQFSQLYEGFLFEGSCSFQLHRVFDDNAQPNDFLA